MNLQYILCLLIAYLIGGINPSYIIARIKGFDIRTKGSGNAGASNAVITMGKAVGIFSALFDILKAYFAVVLASKLFPDLPFIADVAGAACILGHMFPALMGFRGGKGLACLGGVILAFDWKVFLILLAAELLLVLIVDYICVVPITASVIFPVLKGILTRSVGGSLVLSVASVAILFRHRENIRRIREGKEAHFSLLWNRKKELERLQGDSGKDEK